ncbi:MAG: hypothetical protein ABJH06_10830 [Paraglaciecola sp.]|uniref:hypothetical protein n=1 Tax=Paraglaciecola sp. TaxID=1920173 RepID=UPI0032668A8D
MLAVAIILTTLGIYLLNNHGALTRKMKNQILGISTNIVAASLFCNLYGVTRGLFIYLAMFALLGMLLTFLLGSKKRV